MYEDPLSELLPDYELYLRAAGKSPNTLATYLRSARELIAFLGAQMPASKVTHRHVQRYLAHLANRPHHYKPDQKVAPAYVNNQYRGLLQLFKWLVDVEEELAVNPMRKVEAPPVPEKLVPVIEDADMRALIKACIGNRFTDRRDMAIVRLLLDTGARRAEIVNLKLEDVQFSPNAIFVVGKGQRPRIIPFGQKTALALRRYMRSRAKHRLADSTNALLLGTRGAMSITGLRSILDKRTSKAGITRIHPHQFRHSLADAWLRSGGSETDLMHIAGWRSREMLNRYGASVAAERARDAHRRAALGDRFL